MTTKRKTIALSAATATIGEVVVLLGSNRSGILSLIGIGVMGTVLFSTGLPGRSKAKIAGGTLATWLVAGGVLGSRLSEYAPCGQRTFSRECAPSFLPTILTVAAATCALSVFPLSIALAMSSQRKSG
jgi:hypothetical protein